MGREPPRMDRVLLGHPARRRDRRPDRLPLVPGICRSDPRHRRGQRRRWPERTSIPSTMPVWKHGRSSIGTPMGLIPAIAIDRDDIAQIVFTSGATADPKGVVIRHRNILANMVPVAKEIDKYKKYARPFSADSLPEPAAAQPHVRPVDGDQHSAAHRRHRGVHAQLQPARHRPARARVAHLGDRVRAEDPRRPQGACAAASIRPPRSRRRGSRFRRAGGAIAGSIACSA